MCPLATPQSHRSPARQQRCAELRSCSAAPPLQISHHVQPMSPAPTCVAVSAGPLAGLHFWVVELLHQLIPWTAVFACVLPLPIKWVEGRGLGYAWRLPCAASALQPCCPAQHVPSCHPS